MCGGGAENRTPVLHSLLVASPGSVVPQLSHAARCTTHLQHTSERILRSAAFTKALQHLFCGRCNKREESRACSTAAMLIKQRGHTAHCKSCQFNLTLPLFNVVRRPRPASYLKTIQSKPSRPRFSPRPQLLQQAQKAQVLHRIPDTQNQLEVLAHQSQLHIRKRCNETCTVS